MAKARFRQAEVDRMIRALQRRGVAVGGVVLDPATGEVRVLAQVDGDADAAEADRLEQAMDAMLG